MVMLYSTGCPRCRVLERKLTDAGIEFCINEDMDCIMEVCNELNTTMVPILEVQSTDDDVKYYNFEEALEWIKEG